MSCETVTGSGWYEDENGTVSQYVWREGRLHRDRTVASWADLPGRDAELAATWRDLCERQKGQDE